MRRIAAIKSRHLERKRVINFLIEANQQPKKKQIEITLNGVKRTIVYS